MVPPATRLGMAGAEETGGEAGTGLGIKLWVRERFPHGRAAHPYLLFRFLYYGAGRKACRELHVCKDKGVAPLIDPLPQVAFPEFLTRASPRCSVLDPLVYFRIRPFPAGISVRF